MAFSPFKKSSKCLITDALFLEVTWEDGKSPEDDSELLGIIEGVDSNLPEGQLLLEESLPYLTFSQAELLFQELLQVYGQFQLKKVAIAHLEGKEVVTEGEVFASPFVLNQDYQTLLHPLITAILTDSTFNAYSYQEKREYFENQIYPAYTISLGITEAALPFFPEAGEQIRTTSQVRTMTQASPVAPPVNQETRSNPNTKTVKRLTIWLVASTLLAVAGLGASAFAFAQLSQKTEQLTYLYQQQKETKTLVSTEHQIDVFCRYFLPSYYSGNKDSLTAFLSDGDAKYTVPKEGTLQSVMLEKMSYHSKTNDYQVTYVLAVKQEETTSIRLSFTVKADKSSHYGFVVTQEPQESDYIK
ncbi:hypothetical protein [Streptococcus sp.]|uniref:hypothetical protein n=1 Tax=Streptococcus sp. TaxID=1306 RepID=UPI002909023E|nr:hypothetical protein [Streptococcus sp.]MDU6443071.1 hypothetical protein [Streptococcus sp.]MDU6639072.1 hypothetical protein [Streptococcus sp.]